MGLKNASFSNTQNESFVSWMPDSLENASHHRFTPQSCWPFMTEEMINYAKASGVCLQGTQQLGGYPMPLIPKISTVTQFPNCKGLSNALTRVTWINSIAQSNYREASELEENIKMNLGTRATGSVRLISLRKSSKAELSLVFDEMQKRILAY